MSKLFFPQLTSGAIVQYPFRRSRQFRTIRNILRDGSLISLPDFDASALTWELEFSGISKQEMASLKALFDATTGRWQAFGFIDPTSNMFAWSSDLNRASWNRSSLIQVAGGQPDPFGGNNAFRITNNGQSLSEFSQTVNAPASYVYCVSGYLRTGSFDEVLILRRGSSGSQTVGIEISTDWRRLKHAVQLVDGGDTFTCGFSLVPGQSIVVYGLQLEAQLSSSAYRSTTAQSAIYPECFWAEDHIDFTAVGPNSFSTSVRIETHI